MDLLMGDQIPESPNFSRYPHAQTQFPVGFGPGLSGNPTETDPNGVRVGFGYLKILDSDNPIGRIFEKIRVRVTRPGRISKRLRFRVTRSVGYPTTLVSTRMNNLTSKKLIKTHFLLRIINRHSFKTFHSWHF